MSLARIGTLGFCGAVVGMAYYYGQDGRWNRSETVAKSMSGGSSRPALVISDQELARDIKSTAISLWNKAVMASTHAATDGLNTAADKVSEEMDVLGKTVKEKVSEIAESKD